MLSTVCDACMCLYIHGLALAVASSKAPVCVMECHVVPVSYIPCLWCTELKPQRDGEHLAVGATVVLTSMCLLLLSSSFKGRYSVLPGIH